MEKREMPSGPVTREEEVVERITRDTDSEISRAVVKSIIEQIEGAQDTVTKNEFN